MSKYRYININNWNIKSKRKRNQFINEFLKNNYSDLMITKKEFIKIHKEEVISMFNAYGWDYSTQSYIADCLESYYWYRDPICYKTSVNNLNLMDFNEEFIKVFGRNILNNKIFLRKIKALRHKEINNLEE